MVLQTGLYSTLAGLALFAGVLIIRFRERWARANTVFLVGFAAGTMLAITFLHILPEAVEAAAGSGAEEWILPACLLSFLGFYVLEQYVIMHPCEEDEACKAHSPTGSLALIAILLHAGLDGVLIGVGFEVSEELGILTTLGILFHKIPVGVTAMSLFYVAGYSTGQAIFRAVGLAVATPVGAVVSYLLIRGVASDSLLGLLLAVSGGSFLYIAASDLIPMTHQRRRTGAILTVFGGAGLMFVAGFFLH
jgi:ZIP family zinc transporter/zinc and cadmium transporter